MLMVPSRERTQRIEDGVRLENESRDTCSLLLKKGMIDNRTTMIGDNMRIST